MTKILKFLSGKKSVIATILGGIVAYLSVKGFLGEQEVILYTVIAGAIFGGASYKTSKIFEKESINLPQ